MPTSGFSRTFCRDRKSTRLNSSHDQNSYAVFCLKKKNWDIIAGYLDCNVLSFFSFRPYVDVGPRSCIGLLFFFFNDTATTEIYTLSHTTLFRSFFSFFKSSVVLTAPSTNVMSTSSGNSLRSEEHTSELQSRSDLVCRLLLEN